ncbi:MAG TPA: HlyD family efflux transporter periplasmic adaptor subunit [Steroidobacteraceae bacterium]|nr:HlyD family efflux transporter periplasmic adaptor subunit [Steroidobacteraceae bacterium]
MRNPAGFAALLVLLLAGCSGDPDAQVALGTLERDRLELPAEAHEPIIEVHVREGDHVAQDQVLLKLDDVNGNAQVANLRAQASGAQHRLDELTRGPRQEDILEARADLAGAEAQLENASKEFERAKELVQRKLTSQSTVDQQRAARDSAEAARKAAHARLTLLLNGTRIEELDQARDTLAQAKAQLQQAELSAERLTVKAPRAGIVEALPYKLGDRPAAGEPVVVLLADGTTYARVYVPEPIRVQVRPDSAASVHVDGVAKPFDGRVRYVSTEATFTPYFALTQKDRSRLSYLAHVDLLGAGATTLPVGIPVEVRFGSSPQGKQ